MIHAAQHTTGCVGPQNVRTDASDKNRTFSSTWKRLRVVTSRFAAALALVCLAATSNALAFDTSHVDPARQTPWTNCTGCHGNDLLGGFTGVACIDCHNDFSSPDPPPTGHHAPTGGDRNDPMTNCASCHGADLMGGIGPSCYTCHGEVWDGGGGNLPPVSDANGPYSGTVGVAVAFDGSGSSDSDGTIVSYDWDFGDGNFGTGVNPTHAYASAGSYTVTLTVTDDGSLTDTDTTTANITTGGGNSPPVVDPGGPYTGSPGVPVQFDGTGTFDPDGDLLTFLWSWGEVPPTAPGFGETPTHTYNDEGTYTVTLLVSDGANNPVPGQVTVVIGEGGENLPPEADAGGPYNGIAGQTVQFNGSGSSDPDGDPLTYSWDFGDGTAGTGMTPTHTYAAAGNYTATLIVNDGIADSLEDTAVVNIVPPNLPPVADAGGPYTGTVGTAVQFDGSGSFDMDGDVLTYQWDFGDGATGVGVMPTHIYTTAGNYVATLTVSDGVNAPQSDTATVDITDDGNPPAPGDADWEIRLPLVGQAGTLNFDEFAGVLFVEASYENYGQVFGIGFDVQTFVIWMDSKGALFLGTKRGNDMMGLVFSFMGRTDTIWFAEPLTPPACQEEDPFGFLSGLLGMFF